MLEFLLAAAVFLPLNPDGDQATLDRLATQNMQVIWSPGYPPAQALNWRGANCESRLKSLQGWDNYGDHGVNWSRVTITQVPSGVRLGEVVRAPGRPLVTLDLAFPDEATSKAALAAMNRLKAACTPQR
jgi:hypothetical protein